MVPTPDRCVWLARHVAPHEPALRAWLRRRVPAGLEVDDVVQETYAVLAALACTDRIASPRAYAFQTAMSLVLRHLRRGRVVTFEALTLSDGPAERSYDPSPEEVLVARQDLRQVLDVIEGLPPKCRQAFMLRRVRGLSQREVAQAMGISESTVEKHIGRALRTLLDSIKDGGTPLYEASRIRAGRRPVSDAAGREQRGC